MNEKEEKNNFITGRKLKEVVFNKSRFSDWIKRNIEKNDLKENKDYFVECITQKNSKNIKVIKVEYYFTKKASRKILLSQRTSMLPNELKKGLMTNQDIFKIIEEITKQDVITSTKIINISDEEYPEQLRKIRNPPKQLYVKGNIDNLKQKC